MPELPEVETIISGLQQNIVGKAISKVQVLTPTIVNNHAANPQVNSHQLHILNQTVQDITRHGKYIKLTTKQSKSSRSDTTIPNSQFLIPNSKNPQTKILIHLRMTGQLFLAEPDYQQDKHVHIVLNFADKQTLIYRDIRKFGRWTIIPEDKNWEDYINAGTDAMDITLNEIQTLTKKYRNKKLKAFLLDQPAIAGIGNIYADEICFNLRVDPEVPVAKVPPQKIHQEIKSVLTTAIKNKGTSVSDYLTSTGARGNFQNLLNVYKQKACRLCKTPITTKKVAGRTSHVCQSCQSNEALS